jgi:hypothetical protein
LESHGLLQTIDNTNLPTFEPDQGNIGNNYKNNDDNGSKPTLIQTAEEILNRVGIEPGKVYQVTKKLRIDGLILEFLPNDMINSIGDGIDWPNSTVYCRRPSEMGVRINLKGREPDGLISSEEYEEIQDQIVKLLSELQTPDNKPAFDFVRKYEDHYSGPQNKDACDVLFLPNEMNNKISTNLIGTKFTPINSYEHQVDGVFLAKGPSIQTDSTLSHLSLIDVAPIIIGLLGYDIPNQMTGVVPEGILPHHPQRSEYDVEYAMNDSKNTTSKEIEDRLADLGYL